MSNALVSSLKEFVFGEVDKAIILIHDQGAPERQPKEAVQPKSKGSFGGNIADLDKSKITDVGDVSKLQDPLKSQAINLQSGLAGKINGLKGNITYNKEFQVQFNPSSLRLSSQRYEDEDVTKVDGTGANTSTKGENYPIMELNVTLVFERVVHNEAFIRDSSLSNASTAMYSAYNNILKEALDKDGGFFDNRSVQTMVEGFTAAIRKDTTKEIAFCWSSMFYEGMLKNVRTTYTMFDLHGRPIRGEVALSILLSDSDINNTNMGYWMEAYDSAFGYKELGAAGNLKNIVDKVGGIVDTVSSAAVSTGGALQGLAGMVMGVAGMIEGAVEKEDEASPSEKLEKQIQKKQEERKKNAERKFVSGAKNDSGIALTKDKLDEINLKRAEAQEKREEERKARQEAVKDREEKAREEAEKKGKEYYEVEYEEVSRKKSDDSTKPDTPDDDDDDDQEPVVPPPEKPDTRTPVEKEMDEAGKAVEQAHAAETAAEQAIATAEAKVKTEAAKLEGLKAAEEQAQREFFTVRDAEDAARAKVEAIEAEIDALEEEQEKLQQAYDYADYEYQQALEAYNSVPEGDPRREGLKTELDNALTERTAKKGDLDKNSTAIKTKQDDLKTANTDLDEKVKNTKAKNDAYDDATHKRLEGEVDFGIAKDELDYAKYESGAAVRESQEAEERFEKAKEAYDKEHDTPKPPSINEMINNSGSGGGITEI